MEVGLIEETEREALLRAGLEPQPVVGDGSELRHQCRDVRGRDDAKRAAVLLEPSNRLPVPRGGAALHRERREVYFRVFAEFDEGEPEVRIAVKMRGADLVEDRHAAEVVASFEEGADEA